MIFFYNDDCLEVFTEFRFYIVMSKLKLLNFYLLYDHRMLCFEYFLVSQCFILKLSIKSLILLPPKRKPIKFWLILEKFMICTSSMLPTYIQKMFAKWMILSKEGKNQSYSDINDNKLKISQQIGMKAKEDCLSGLSFVFYISKKFLSPIL